jgi:hypothetical protein
MKFSYTIDQGNRIIFQNYSGRFTADQVIASVRALWADPLYDKTFGGIVDITGMEAGKDLADLHALIRFLADNRHQISTGRWAVITTSPIATAGAFFYQHAMAGKHPFDVFSTWEAASNSLHWFAPRPELPEHAVV